MTIPHPIPYQGSKRNLASQILEYFPSDIKTLFEPFAGSSAISLATASKNLATNFHLNDLNKPLIDLLEKIISTPEKISKEYEKLWNAQHEKDKRKFYDEIRDAFNKSQRPDHFLYLLARCVKGSVRYNSNGEFNQSPDNRRNGSVPSTMKKQIIGVSSLLNGKTTYSSDDYKNVVTKANEQDLIYFDPPYQGVCGNRDSRYFAGINHDEFIEVLDYLNKKNISFVVSYDGKTGDKTHGKILPEFLELKRIELSAGRSSQHTLLGNSAITIESLYLSKALLNRLENAKINQPEKESQLLLVT